MSRRSIPGVSGVLGDLLTEQATETEATSDTKNAPTAPAGQPIRARSGRPPGAQTASSRRKDKLTVRIDAELVEQYRDWSWDARCNLGTLVERAMQLHLRARSREK